MEPATISTIVSSIFGGSGGGAPQTAQSGQSLNVSGIMGGTSLADLSKLQAQAWWTAPSYLSGVNMPTLPTLPGLPTLPQLQLQGASQYQVQGNETTAAAAAPDEGIAPVLVAGALVLIILMVR